MNLSRESEKQNKQFLKLYNPYCENQIHKVCARENALTIIDLNSIKNKLNTNEIIFISCKNLSFIPLTLSLDINSSNLKLEHTHPPAEMFSGKNRNKLVSLLKKNWLK